MDRQVTADLIQEGSKLLSRLLQVYATRRHAPDPPAAEMPAIEKHEPAIEKEQVERRGVSTEQTIAYQRRELAKELILLEGHLQQACKIGGEACDCCEKHPLKIEGLAQETAGMTAEPIYSELASWVREIAPAVTAEASASGEYEQMYPELAMQAREFRKAIMPESITKEVSDAPEEAS